MNEILVLATMNDVIVPGSVLGTMFLLIAGWLLSGRIRTTDADQLWKEARNLRTDQAAIIKELREDNDSLSKRIDALFDDVELLRAENIKLRKQVEKLELENHRLQEKNTWLTARVAELESPKGVKGDPGPQGKQGERGATGSPGK